MEKIYLIFVMLFMLMFIISCSYNPPVGATEKHHTYEEVSNNKDKYDISSNFKLADTNIGTTNGINTIPLYMAFLIK